MTTAPSPDVLVVGAGLIGLACARELAQAGLRVELLEASDKPANAASAAAAGMLAPLAEAPSPGSFFDACRASRKLWASWHQQIEEESGKTTGYNTAGALLVALDEEQEAHNERLTQAARSLGEPVEAVPLADLRNWVPAISPHALSARLLVREYSVDNVRAGAALTTATERAGVRIRLNHRVERIETADGTVCVTGQGWSRSAAKIVIANGAWSGQLLGLSPLPVHPVRGQMLSIGKIDWSWTGVVRGPHLYAVRRQGHLVVGATVEEAGFAIETTLAGQQELSTKIQHLLPRLGSHPMVSTWAGLRPGTPDERPMLGPIGGCPEIVIASGHYRNGILLAPWTGKMIKSAILQGELPAAAQPFDVNRF